MKDESDRPACCRFLFDINWYNYFHIICILRIGVRAVANDGWAVEGREREGRVMEGREMEGVMGAIAISSYRVPAAASAAGADAAAAAATDDV